MRVAFLGLGIMGRSMAANVVKAGHEVAIWNRSGGKDVEGARTAASPADAAKGAEVVWMCVSDTKAVESVLFGPNGVEHTLAAGMIIADSSTISPSATRRFAERVKARGVDYVDAPMTGSKIAAAAGSLIFMVGGDEAVLARLQPLFQAMGKQVFHMGDTGKGQATKLVMNLQIALIYEGFAGSAYPGRQARCGRGQTGAAGAGFDGAIGSGGLQSSIYFATRLFAEFSAAADAERHSPGARRRQGIAGAPARTRSRGRGLRRGGRGRPGGSGLRRDAYFAGEMGGCGSEKCIKVD